MEDLAPLQKQVGVYKQPDNETNTQLVNRLLSENARGELYAGVSGYQQQHTEKVKTFLAKSLLLTTIPSSDPQFFRKAFIEHINTINQKSDNHYKPGNPDIRATSPEKATVTMEGFLGKIGTELYRLALEEEMNSNEYRDAVFSASTTHYEGEKWAKRAVVIVAGPSGSGKTASAVAAVQTTGQFMEKVDGDMSGNDVVAVDGGVAREVSQIRKLAIQVTTNKGYTGIKDLHGHSSVLGKTKDCIQEALFKTTTNVGVVIPETFSMWIKPLNQIKKLMPRIEALENTKHVFCRVEGEEPSLFQKVVGFLGSRRAWKTDGFDQEQTIDMNNSQGMAESKAYGAEGFKFGDFGSRQAEKWFEKNSKDKLRMVVINDLLLLKPSAKEPGQWEPAEQNDKGTIVVSRRTFEQWKIDKPDMGLKEYSAKNRPPPLIKTSAEIELAIGMEMMRQRIQGLSAEKSTANDPTWEKLDSKEEKLIDIMSTLNKVNMADKAAVDEAKNKLTGIITEMKTNNEFGFFSKSQKAIEIALNALEKTSNALVEKKSENVSQVGVIEKSSESTNKFSSFKAGFAQMKAQSNNEKAQEEEQQISAGNTSPAA
ncbi:hypothetical protein ACFORL_01120 [Legionella dresdenensis]|uniref:Uncharacterized protein n=1 Tax=Legionella dresdenensis TaxID=450200 RepID=A0ABV8CBN8_9GAMM